MVGVSPLKQIHNSRDTFFILCFRPVKGHASSLIQTDTRVVVKEESAKREDGE